MTHRPFCFFYEKKHSLRELRESQLRIFVKVIKGDESAIEIVQNVTQFHRDGVVRKTYQEFYYNLGRFQNDILLEIYN